jgi:hypothetical protein
MMQPNGFEPGPAVMVDPNTGLIVGEPPADGQTPQPVLTVQTLQTDAPGMTNAAPQSSELPPGADNDVLRRLMERREQEMNR